MDVLDIVTNIIRYCGRVVKLGADIQEPARGRFVSDLQGMCSNAEDSYGQVLKRLLPVRSSSNDPARFAIELHSFRADIETRNAFKPEHLCGRIDQILVDLESNLNALKYSLEFRRLKEVKQGLGAVGYLDDQVYTSYDKLTSDLDGLATRIESNLGTNEPAKARGTASQALLRILVFEDKLRTGIADLRDVKNRILHG